METSNKNQIANRIQKSLTTKSGSIRSCFSRTVEFLNSESVKYTIHFWTGSRNHMRLVETNIEQGLNLLGIDYKVINDAPRGGKEGDKIQLTKKGIGQVKRYRDFVKKQNEAILEKEAQASAAIEAEKQAKKDAFKQNMSQYTGGELLINYFKNEIYPAPAPVVKLKQKSGLSWNQLRNLYK